MAQLILLADDDMPTRRRMEIMLKRMGFEVDIVKNGQEAVECVQGKDYDLVLMDLQMPKLDGRQATAKIRENGSNVKIVALTGDKLCDSEELLQNTGMNGVIIKTSDRDHFQAQVTSFLK